MERELVELQVALQVEQQANEGLAEGAGTDDVDDAFGTHLVSSSRWRVFLLQGAGAHCTEGTAAKASQRGASAGRAHLAQPINTLMRYCRSHPARFRLALMPRLCPLFCCKRFRAI